LRVDFSSGRNPARFQMRFVDSNTEKNLTWAFTPLKIITEWTCTKSESVGDGFASADAEIEFKNQSPVFQHAEKIRRKTFSK